MATTSLSLDHTAVLLSQFYKKSDDPEDHHGYADFFTDEASLIMGLKHYKGREGRLSPEKTKVRNPTIPKSYMGCSRFSSSCLD